jgi:hypothetical protein
MIKWQSFITRIIAKKPIKLYQMIRDVLYWNPDLKAQDKAPSAIQFYNNDTPKNYQVIIIGFDKDDKPLYWDNAIIRIQ